MGSSEGTKKSWVTRKQLYGKTGVKDAESFKEKRRAWMIVNSPMKNPEVVRLRIGQTRIHQSEIMTGERNHMYGKKATEQAKEKMVLAHARERRAFLNYLTESKGKVFHPSSVCDAIEILSDGSVWLVEFKSLTDRIRPKQALAKKLALNYKIVQFDENGSILP